MFPYTKPFQHLYESWGRLYLPAAYPHSSDTWAHGVTWYLELNLLYKQANDANLNVIWRLWKLMYCTIW